METLDNKELKREYIGKQVCFAKLTPSELDELSTLLSLKRFNEGDTIVTEGEPVDSVYLILNGKADVRHIRIKDHAPEITSLATLGEGAAIGLNETGFYSLSGIRTATVVALTTMDTFRLSVAAFHGFALANHHVVEVMRQNAEAFMGVKS